MADDCGVCGLPAPCDCDDGGKFGAPPAADNGDGGEKSKSSLLMKDDFVPEERDYIAKLHKSFDTDSSGKIGMEELKLLAKKFGVETSDEDFESSTKHMRGSCSIPALVDWLKDLQKNEIDNFSILKVKMKAQGKKALTNSQIDGLHECFNHFDQDNSGSIDISELGDVFKAFGQEMSSAELDQMMSEVDDDGSGEMEFEEFLMLMISNFGEEAGAEQELVEEVQKFDEGENGTRSGKISIDTLKRLMREVCGEYLTEDDISRIAGGLESTDGLIEYMKWEELWEALRE